MLVKSHSATLLNAALDCFFALTLPFAYKMLLVNITIWLLNRLVLILVAGEHIAYVCCEKSYNADNKYK